MEKESVDEIYQDDIVLLKSLYSDRLGREVCLSDHVFFQNNKEIYNVSKNIVVESDVGYGYPFSHLFQHVEVGGHMGKVNFVFNGYRTIPEKIFIDNLTTNVLRCFQIRLVNEEFDVINVIEINSPVTHILVKATNFTSLKRNENLTINLYVLPQSIEQFCSTLRVVTDIGILPIPVCVRTIHENHFHYDVPISSTINPRQMLPIAIIRHSKEICNETVVFDTNVFSEVIYIEEHNIFKVEYNGNLSPGFYLTYISFIHETFVNTYPLWFHIFLDPIAFEKPFYHITLTDIDINNNCDLVVMNPTGYDYTLIDVSFSNDFASVHRFIRSEDDSIRGFKKVRIGTILLRLGEQSDYMSKITLTYAANDDSSVLRIGTMITVHVVTGAILSTNRSVYISNNEESFNLKLFNMFSTPCIILGIMIEENCIYTEDFRPFMLPTNEFSSNIPFYLKGSKSSDSTLITVYTNISKLTVPVYIHAGNVYLSTPDTPEVYTDNLMFHYPFALENFIYPIDFLIFNPSHSIYRVNSIKSYNGVADTNHMLDDFPEIGDFETDLIKFEVSFTELSLNNQPSVVFVGDRKNFSIVFEFDSYSVYQGHITLIPEFDVSRMYFGNKYKGKIYAISSYAFPLHINNIRTEKKDFTITLLKSILQPKVKTYIGKCVIHLTSELLVDTTLSKLLSMNTNIGNGIEINHSLDVYIDSNGGYTKLQLSVVIKTTEYNNYTYHNNRLLPSMPVDGVLLFENPLDSNMEINILNKHTDFIYFSKYSYIIDNHSVGRLNYTFRPYEVGNFDFSVLVTTNCTTPIFFNFYGNINYPNTSFVVDGKESDSILFSSVNDREYIIKRWVKTITLVNRGNSVVNILKTQDHFDSTYVFDTDLSCLDIGPGEKCEFDMFVNIVKLRYQNETFKLNYRINNHETSVYVHVNLTRATFSFIYRLRISISMFFAFLILACPISVVTSTIFNHFKCRAIIKEKMKKVQKEIRILEMRDTETQTVSEKFRGGCFTPATIRSYTLPDSFLTNIRNNIIVQCAK